MTARAETLPAVFRLELSRDELTLITTHISAVVSSEILKRPSFSVVERVLVGTRLSRINDTTNREFVERHGMSALLDLVQRLAQLGGRPFVEPLKLED